jgi:hypothetical protein
MGVPLNHPFIDGFFHYKSSSYWGSPIYGSPHIRIQVESWDTMGMFNIRGEGIKYKRVWIF